MGKESLYNDNRTVRKPFINRKEMYNKLAAGERLLNNK